MSDTGLDTMVFVYGTLKMGEPNHHWLAEGRGRSALLGPGLTSDIWPLVVVTEYNIPMLLGIKLSIIIFICDLYNLTANYSQIARAVERKLKEKFTKLI